MKTTINVLGSLLLVICILMLLAVFLAPPLLGFTFNTILSGSMEPAIKMGGVIGMERVTPEEVQVGDVIGFRVEGMDIPVVHRVIELKQTEEGVGFRTKGDANEEVDPWVVEPENLAGRVIFHLPYVGFAARFVKTRYGVGLLLGLPAAIIIALEIKSLFWSKTIRRRPKLRKKTGQVPAYPAIIIGLILIGVLWGMMAGNTHARTLGSFAQRSEGGNQPLYLSQRIIQNRGMLPLVILFFSEDEMVTFSENYFRLSPGRQRQIEISGDCETSVIKTGGFFPLLPQGTLFQLFSWNSRFAPLVTAAVWILPLTIIAFLVLRGLSSKPKLAERAKLMKRRLSYA